jgi:ATP-binding cassette subfamily B multidrug efflux pump
MNGAAANPLRDEASPTAASKPSRVFRRIFAEALAHPWGLVATVTTSVAGALANLVVPRLIGRMVDQVHALVGAATTSQAHMALLASGLLMILATTGRGLLSMASSYLGERLSQQVALALRLRYFDKLQRLPFAFHDSVHSGDLITRGMLDLEGMRVFIQAMLLNALPLVLLVGLAGAMMVRVDPVLAAVSLGFAPFAAYALARSGTLLRRTWYRVQEQMSRLTLIMEENLQGVRVARAFAAERFELAKFDQAAGNILQLQFHRITLRFAGVAWMTATFHLSLGLLLWFGGRKVMAGQMTVGRLAEFIAYLTVLQGPIRQIAMIFNVAARAASSGERMYEILDRPTEIADAPDAPPLNSSPGVLKFQNVWFRYKAEGPDVLRGIDLEVRPGRTLALVGAPGSGKSTIASLIPRFYDVTAGAITIDGVDIRDVSLDSLRRHVGLVQQEAFLFDAPIGHNLAYADPWAQDDRIVESARVAQLHDHVASLPDRYDARVGERGVSLSGGQRQRASIARGILPGPGVVVLDDSTAAIDAVTEANVRAGLARLTRDKATIVIAHRLSSVLHADEIVVLDEGRVVERGDHAGLLAQGGIYARLWALQSRQARDIAPAPADRNEERLASA